VVARLRAQEGFGLIELLIAMLFLSIALLGILAAFTAGQTAIRRASRLSTAATLADQQLELYRALTYSAIALDNTSVQATDATYRGDVALGGSISNDVTTTTGCTGLPNQCVPSRSLTGPDHGSYRVDTYVVSQSPTNGRANKLVTVVVRDETNLGGKAWARVTAAFDQSTGT
jgi:type II secretory pathway pseudopilin PulG